MYQRKVAYVRCDDINIVEHQSKDSLRVFKIVSSILRVDRNYSSSDDLSFNSTTCYELHIVVTKFICNVKLNLDR